MLNTSRCFLLALQGEFQREQYSGESRMLHLPGDNVVLFSAAQHSVQGPTSPPSAGPRP